MACNQKAANRGASKVIPVVVSGIIVYGAFAFTKPLCIDYLIDPIGDEGLRSPRKGLAVGLLAGFYTILTLMLVSYIRVLSTIQWNPGYVPRGSRWTPSRSKKSKRRGRSRKKQHRSSTTSNLYETDLQPWAYAPAQNGQDAEKAAFAFDACGLEEFFAKDVFVCQHDGRPRWCSTCCQFKTDRVHHCREVGRCVRKLDHFCPWVGGVVSETSFKYFIQFVFYAFLFTVYNLVIFAFFTAELGRESGDIEIHWIVALVLTGFFSLVAMGMLISSLQLALLNSSTIESLDRRSKVWTLAILIPRPKDFHSLSAAQGRSIPTTAYPNTATTSTRRSSLSSQATNTAPREFAIVSTQPGENPFDLGSPLANLKEVMGHSILDWILPLKRSPCAEHNGEESIYALGPVVQRLRREVGLDKSE